MDLYIRMERGPNGKWGISWSKVFEVDMDPSVGQVPNLYNNKPKQKPVFKWQPRPYQPRIPSILAQNQTHPHSKPSSHVPLSHPNILASTIASLVGSNKTEVEPTPTHMEPTCTKKLLSVINNSDASVEESLVPMLPWTSPYVPMVMWPCNVTSNGSSISIQTTSSRNGGMPSSGFLN